MALYQGKRGLKNIQAEARRREPVPGLWMIVVFMKVGGFFTFGPYDKKKKEKIEFEMTKTDLKDCKFDDFKKGSYTYIKGSEISAITFRPAAKKEELNVREKT